MSSLPPLNDGNDGKINLNQATVEQLETLPGIGPSKAEDILSYREEVGSFKAIEDLKEVSGIGEKTFEKLKNLISVD
ncbi:ComEA family DNA-binding protein [Cytobacillus kochii]|uniref:ComEA family DNA-binding protein n=1 Tax=Cytobacillus kochii TaxID=859143 RepID=UPI0025A18785|nr:helix-hairpin-helix domain-containing protein [Cytobacillus kochii]MDM5208543.1 helix-hairpin-helix domain-containing protein [Cytobacillus kochii]